MRTSNHGDAEDVDVVWVLRFWQHSELIRAGCTPGVPELHYTVPPWYCAWLVVRLLLRVRCSSEEGPCRGP